MRAIRQQVLFAEQSTRFFVQIVGKGWIQESNVVLAFRGVTQVVACIAFADGRAARVEQLDIAPQLHRGYPRSLEEQDAARAA